MDATAAVAAKPDRPAGFARLTPWRCRAVLAALLAVHLGFHLWYVGHGPIDLSGDEAHYWDWSRRLDWSYYSKGPLVALIIRGSCQLFGDTPAAVRYPAVLLSVLSTIVTYLLTLRLFRSDRLALGVTLLGSLIPLFIAGGFLMTIDPPFYLCWGLASYLLTFAVPALVSGERSDRHWGAWIAIGLIVGIGALAKLASLVWLAAMLLVLAVDRSLRPVLKTGGPWLAVAIALACTTPIVAWNARHDWVSFRHVARQTGLTATDDKSNLPGRVGEFLGSQAGVVGPVGVFMIAGALYAFRADNPHRRALRMLAVFGVSFFAACFLLSFLTKVQGNWPAPAYFTLAILAGYFLATQRKEWIGRWLQVCIVYGVILHPLLHDFSLAYPLLKRLSREPAKLDPSARLRGWREVGERVSADLRPGEFILCEDYQQTALLAFYTAGRPITYCAGSYYARPKRLTQYDFWPDRRLDSPDLIGRDAVLIGKGGAIHPDVAAAFERVEKLSPIEVVHRGVKVRSVTPWRGYGFKGMHRPAGQRVY